jgi:hypothetical protein
MNYISSIKDITLATQIDASLSWVIRCTTPNRQTTELVLFKLQNWIAVPVTPEILLNPSLTNHVVTVLQQNNYTPLYAVRLFAIELDSYLVPTTVEGLNEFRRYLGALPTVLFAGDERPDWIWLSIESDVSVVAGTEEFVSQLLPWEIEDGVSRFRHFINQPMLQELRQYLRFVSDQLSNYQAANEGEEFCLSPPSF